MILAAHQPNFLPYMGYFYKMYMCDVFALSDTVGYSKQGYHNYNFVYDGTEEKKLTIPVSNKSGAVRNALLCDWEHNRTKTIKRLIGYYSKAPHFKEVWAVLQGVFDKDYTYLYELNTALLKAIHDAFGFECKIIMESDLQVPDAEPTQQIAWICKATGCNTYLSGVGACEYLLDSLLINQGVTLVWSGYKPLQYGTADNLSVIDYIMNKGFAIPDEWKKDKERMQAWQSLPSAFMSQVTHDTKTS